METPRFGYFEIEFTEMDNMEGKLNSYLADLFKSGWTPISISWRTKNIVGIFYKA